MGIPPSWRMLVTEGKSAFAAALSFLLLFSFCEVL